MAKDPDPGTHSPAGHPYPLWCLFLKNRSKVSPSSCNTFNPNHGWQTQLRSTWLNRKNYFQLSSWTLLPQQRCPSSPAFDLVSLALLPPPHSLYSGARASSHCGAESNVTGPGCSVLPSLYKGPISAEAYHHTGSLGREGAVCERRGKCRDLGSQSGRPPTAYWD